MSAKSSLSAFSFDVGAPSPGSDEVEGWRSTISLRAGYSRYLNSVFAVSGYVDYYSHRPILGEGMYPHFLSSSSARRRDVAAYATVSVFSILEVGAGVYYTKADPVDVIFSSLGSVTQYHRRWTDSGLSEFRFLGIVAFGYDIPIVTPISLPVQLFFRNTYGANNTLPVYLRIGMRMRL